MLTLKITKNIVVIDLNGSKMTAYNCLIWRQKDYFGKVMQDYNQNLNGYRLRMYSFLCISVLSV